MERKMLEIYSFYFLDYFFSLFNLSFTPYLGHFYECETNYYKILIERKHSSIEFFFNDLNLDFEK